MKVETAQLPGPDESDDRILVTTNAIIMLDGASSFLPTSVPAGDYVDQLGGYLFRTLSEEPNVDLVVALAEGIEQTAKALDLEPGRSPSSTVAVLRVVPENHVDALVLGDTQVVWPGGVIRDERIASVGVAQRKDYQGRLAAGAGFDDEHRSLLRRLQEEQARFRNRPDGYWIAENDPSAARQAMTAHLTAAAAPWAVLATDGAYRPIERLGLDEWDTVARQSSEGLHSLLAECHRWEARSDPNATKFPRAKRHDDKAIAAYTSGDTDR